VILADTSAWVEYDRGTGSTADQRIAELIAGDGPLMVTEPVLMEVLAGARRTICGACCSGLVWRPSMPSPISPPPRESIDGVDKRG
jgi:predicted nucleic acid-binding protein